MSGLRSAALGVFVGVGSRDEAAARRRRLALHRAPAVPRLRRAHGARDRADLRPLRRRAERGHVPRVHRDLRARHRLARRRRAERRRRHGAGAHLERPRRRARGGARGDRDVRRRARRPRARPDRRGRVPGRRARTARDRHGRDHRRADAAPTVAGAPRDLLLRLEHRRLRGRLGRPRRARRAGRPRARLGAAPASCRRARRSTAESPPGAPFLERDTEQFHLCLGAPGVSRHDERRFATSLLDQLLGGGASSRLFQEIRERRGMAYAVYTFGSHYRETGHVGVYVGTRARERRGVPERDRRARSASVAGGRLRPRRAGAGQGRHEGPPGAVAGVHVGPHGPARPRHPARPAAARRGRRSRRASTPSRSRTSRRWPASCSRPRGSRRRASARTRRCSPAGSTRCSSETV